MNFPALLTAVCINIVISLSFLTLFCILKRQRSNAFLYSPRLLDKKKSKHRVGDSKVWKLLPSVGWVRKAWQLSDDDILSNSGLDGLVFTRIFVFSLKMFTFGAIIGIFVLLPVNYLGNHLDIDGTYYLSNTPVDYFSISNVNDGSNWLWIHFSAAYIFTGVVCYLLYYEYNYVSSKRIAYFYSSKPQPHQFTILVRSIPSSSGRSFSEIVESFFTEYHPSTYLSHSVIHKTSKLRGLMSLAESLSRKLASIKKETHAKQYFKRDGCLGLFGRKVNVLDDYEKQLGDLEDNVRMEQCSLAGKEVPAAFVSFKSRFGAAVAVRIEQGVNPMEWVTEKAPDPQDVHWPLFSASYRRIWFYKLLAVVGYIAFTLLFLFPVVIVQGLANLKRLETWFPFLKGILSLTVVSQLITGYLPSLILQSFLLLMPPMMLLFSSMEGYISQSQIEKSACAKVLYFTIWNIFLANLISGSAFYWVEVFLEPENIPRVLAEAAPSQASFFISYVLSSGWSSLASKQFRLIPMLGHCTRKLCSITDGEKVPAIQYYEEIPSILFFGLLGVAYFFLAPLILPFILIYFFLGCVTFRNQLYHVYAPKYETSGYFWPVVHNYTIFSLILMHIIAIGMFGLKKLPLASSLTIPLPVLTLVFNGYCRKRFLPLFKAYPTECLIKKDREDQNDPRIHEFYDKLVTAYRDPALRPLQYSRNDDSDSSPLLPGV